MKSFQEVQKELEELEKSRLYSPEQLQIIKYAAYRRDFDETLLFNPAMPSEYMEMYVQLKTMRKIDIKYYILENWHLLGFSPKQLYLLIIAHAQNIDISRITSNMSEEEIKEFLNNQQIQKITNKTRKESSLSSEEIEKIKSIGFSSDVELFLLRVGEHSKIDVLLNHQLRNCSLEQMKYLFAVYSTGTSIDHIMNPNLSVNEMKNIILTETESLEFLQDVQDNHIKRGK